MENAEPVGKRKKVVVVVVAAGGTPLPFCRKRVQRVLNLARRDCIGRAVREALLLVRSVPSVLGLL